MFRKYRNENSFQKVTEKLAEVRVMRLVMVPFLPAGTLCVLSCVRVC